MTTDYNSALRSLRPPFTQPMPVSYTFSRTDPQNKGLTFTVPVNQPLVAPGDGSVDLISRITPQWHNDFGSRSSIAVRIDHGFGIKTWVHGLASAVVRYGLVTRGQLLGYPSNSQVFFGLELNGNLTDPTAVNYHFGLMDGSLGFQKGGKVHQAPDLITTVSTYIQTLISRGIRYFITGTPAPVLFNLDFNGSGTKSGAAVVGYVGDSWNAIAAIDFEISYYAHGYNGRCEGGLTHPGNPGFFLTDYQGSATKVYFEREVLSSAAGQSSFFDPMLSSWVGGYTGITPRLNTFTILNLPNGTYDLYLYSNGGETSDVTTVYCSVNGGVPDVKVATPTVAAVWVEDGNYVKFSSLSVPFRGSITLAVYGYLAGLQLRRR